MKLVLPLVACAVVAHGEEVGIQEHSSVTPVSKVITLIKDMMKELDKEAEEDEEMYDKLSCWCATNDQDKTKAIKDGEVNIVSLTSAIETLTASSAKLSVEIKGLQKEVATNQNALDQAISIRMRQKAEFAAEDKEMTVAIHGIQSAIDVVQKQTAFLQTKGKSQTKNDNIGVLQAMKMEFEKNLDEAKKDDAANENSFQELKGAKEEEISAGQEQIDMKTQQLASTDEKIAESVEGKSDGAKALVADREFLAMLKEKCSQTDTQWEQRQKTRMQEIQACSKALAVMNSEVAQTLFSNTFSPDFMQVERREQSKRRTEASKLLSTVSRKFHSPRLAALSTKVKLDAFTKVKQAISEMITQLGAEQQDEIAHRDFCIEEFNTNKLETDRKNRNKATLLSNIEDFQMSINTLSGELDTLKSDMNEMRTQMKRAGEDREAENVLFQKTIADQRASIRLLTAALDILKGFYEKESLLQREERQPGMPEFEAYKKNEGSSSVMKMISEIVADAKRMEADTTRAEEDAQKSYEEEVKDTNNNLGIKSEESINKNEERAKAESDLIQAKTDKDNTLILLEQLNNRKGELHKSCDFIMNNFDARQSARDEEINALKQAKDILSGARFQSLLQMQ